MINTIYDTYMNGVTTASANPESAKPIAFPLAIPATVVVSTLTNGERSCPFGPPPGYTTAISYHLKACQLEQNMVPSYQAK